MSLPTAPIQSKIAGLVPLEWKNWFNLVCKNVNDTISTLTTTISDLAALDVIVTGHTTILGPLVKIYHAHATIDFGSIAAQSFLSSDVAVAGVIKDDTDPACVIVTPSVPVNGVIFTAFVQANDNVRIRANNYTGAAVDPGSLEFSVTVFET